MMVIDFDELKKLKDEGIVKNKKEQKSHAELLKEAFLALEKYNAPEVY